MISWPQLFGQYFLFKSLSINSPQYLPIEAKWCLPSGRCLLLEVANSSSEQRIGLMNREPLKEGLGMLFPFSPRRKASFWMYKTEPIDMIFYFNGVVSDIKPGLPNCSSLPCISYQSDSILDGVIEIGANQIEKLDIQIGD